MNCHVIKRRLLESENPDRPAGELLVHLAGCPSCLQWQQRLLLLEANVPLLPVPPSQAREGLLQRLMTIPPGWAVVSDEAGIELPELNEPRPSAPRSVRPGIAALFGPRLLRQRRLVAAGLAAAVTLVLLGWWAWPRQASATPDPLVAQLVQRDLRLAEAASPRQRVELLADLADDLHAEVRAVVRAARTDDVQALARLYRKVVHDGLVKQAEALPAAEGQLVCAPISARLARTGRDAEIMAQDVPAAADPLRLMAAAAREGGEQIHHGSVTILAGMDFPAPPAVDARRLKQLQRNRLLVQALVDGGLQLAATEDPLQRADCCNRLAETFAGEIQRAAISKEGARAAELGQHFQAVLQRGVAGNLSTARKETPPGSMREEAMRRVAEHAAHVTRPVEDQLEHATDTDPEEMRHALKAVHGGWTEVEKAFKEQPTREATPSTPH